MLQQILTAVRDTNSQLNKYDDAFGVDYFVKAAQEHLTLAQNVLICVINIYQTAESVPVGKPNADIW